MTEMDHTPPETAIQAGRPVPNTTIQAGRPTEGPSPGLSLTLFLARLRNLLQLHVDLATSRPNPPMWTAVQIGAFALACMLGYRVFTEMLAIQVEKELALVCLVITFFVVILLPDGLLKMARRMQKTAARQAVLDSIVMTVRAYPEEVEQSGGVEVLADHVELEALVQILEDKCRSEPPPPG